jgi:hypothetical protein
MQLYDATTTTVTRYIISRESLLDWVVSYLDDLDWTAEELEDHDIVINGGEATHSPAGQLDAELKDSPGLYITLERTLKGIVDPEADDGAE